MYAIKNILYTQYAQYRTSQENMDLINQKYHDLKHQLQIIRDESNQDKKNEYIDEIEAGIQLVSIVDGTLLSHIHVVENYCESKILIENGSIPITTKNDKRYHGYGIKSIKHSVEKYGGYVNITNNNNWFRVEMLFPKVNK